MAASDCHRQSTDRLGQGSCQVCCISAPLFGSALTCTTSSPSPRSPFPPTPPSTLIKLSPRCQRRLALTLRSRDPAAVCMANILRQRSPRGYLGGGDGGGGVVVVARAMHTFVDDVRWCVVITSLVLSSCPPVFLSVVCLRGQEPASSAPSPNRSPCGIFYHFFFLIIISRRF